MTLAQTVATRDGNALKTLDNAIITFNEGMQLGKFYFGEQDANIYIPKDGNDYSIAYSDRNGDIPLYFKAKETGTYIITFDGDDMSGIKLIDKFKNEVVDLGIDDSYTFKASSVDRKDRFVLVFSSTSSETSSEPQVFAYQSGSDIIIEGEGELQMFDVMGRLVSIHYINGVETIPAPQIGVYMLKLNDKVQKIVVR
jgi:hypothetical protein